MAFVGRPSEASASGSPPRRGESAVQPDEADEEDCKGEGDQEEREAGFDRGGHGEIQQVRFLSTERLIRDRSFSFLSFRYVSSIDPGSVAQLGPTQLGRIRSRLRPEWFETIVLKKLAGAVLDEVAEDYSLALRRAVVEYVLMDEGERKRTNVKVSGKMSDLPLKVSSSSRNG